MNRPKAKTIAFVLVCFLAGALGLGAVDVQSGRVRLVLHEGSGRYSLYLVPAGEPRRHVPLFVDQDPRTSGLSVVVNGRVFRIGEGAEFRETAEPTAAGARFVWESRNLRIIQDFAFVAALDAAAPAAVHIELTLTNLSAAPMSVGVRDFLDTYLGESRSAHFRSGPGGEIAAETLIPADRMIRYWVSGDRDAAEAALQRITSGGEVTPPDRIVFANWKRLNQAPWSYDVSPGRSFNLLPYSINDSAVCQYYDALTLAPGGTRRIVSILGGYSAAGYPTGRRAAESLPARPGMPPEDPGTAAAEELRPGTPGREPSPREPRADLPSEALSVVRDAVVSLNELLERIDTKLSSGQALTDEDVQLIEEALSDIKSRTEPHRRNP